MGNIKIIIQETIQLSWLSIYPRNFHEPDDQKYLFSSCLQVISLYQKYKFTNYYEVFDGDFTVERYKQTERFVRETKTEHQKT